jgi:hypothetical protein
LSGAKLSLHGLLNANCKSDSLLMKRETGKSV